MSKSILKIGLAIVGIVLAIPTVGASLGLTAIALAAVEVGIALASTLLLGPSVPKGDLTQTALSRLYATLVTTEARRIMFGTTASDTAVRYQTYTGSKQEYYHQLIAHASHQVQSIDEIWIDNEKAWTKIGGVQGRYVNWLTVTTRELATSANGIAIDGVWTASCTLTGCAYTYLQYKLLDTTNSSNASPFQSGISGRLTFRGKGAPTYDPRLDSTVTGGTGTHRAATQSTWAWSDTGSRNPALQLLWFLLGWQINGKIALGMGLPPARIDLASFITAANHCDESVTLAAGGSEPRYRSDGLISEGDDRSTVVQHLCQTMNATLRDSGGKIALQVINNDLATPVATFGLNDILGSEQYEQTQPLNSYFNIVRGRRVDPTDTALYQLTDFPQIVLSSPDGIDRIQTTDYPLVQSNSQAQRLAKLSLKRAQYQAKYTATFGSNAWAVSLGNIVQINHSGMNWTNKLMRVVAQSIGQSGQVKMTLLEESTNVYTWAAEDVAGTVGGTPKVVVPTSLPLGSVAPGATVGAQVGVNFLDQGGSQVLTDAAIKNTAVTIGANGALSGGGGGSVTIGGLGYLGSLTATTNNTTYSATAPVSPVNGDFWVDTSVTPNVTRLRVAGVWQVAANYVTNTNQVTDGANLGGTAAWGGVSARPANLSALAGTETIQNSLVSINSAGLLSGAGGGSVTIGGLGFTGALNATYGATWGTNVGSTPANLAALMGTEVVNNAAISMGASGALAGGGGGSITALDFANVAGGTKPAANADVTTQVVGPTTGSINYDSTGTTAQASVDLNFALGNASGVITSGVTINYKVTSGTLNGFNSTSAAQALTVGANGYGTLTASTLGTDSATVTVSAVMGSVTRQLFLTMTKAKAAATATVAGTVSQTSGFTQLVSPWTSYAALTNVLTLTIPAGKTATSTAISLSPLWNPKNISTGVSQPNLGPWHLLVKLQRSASGANTWVDIGAVQGSSPDPYIDTSSTPTTNSQGTITATISDTGLTAGTTYDYRCVGEISTGATAGNSGGINWGSSGSSVSITT
jgi:hypothetical protein